MIFVDCDVLQFWKFFSSLAVEGDVLMNIGKKNLTIFL